MERTGSLTEMVTSVYTWMGAAFQQGEFGVEKSKWGSEMRWGLSESREWVMQHLSNHGKIFGFYPSTMESLKDGATQSVLVELMLSIRHMDREEAVQTFAGWRTLGNDKFLSHSNWSEGCCRNLSSVLNLLPLPTPGKSLSWERCSHAVTGSLEWGKKAKFWDADELRRPLGSMISITQLHRCLRKHFHHRKKTQHSPHPPKARNLIFP